MVAQVRAAAAKQGLEKDRAAALQARCDAQPFLLGANSCYVLLPNKQSTWAINRVAQNLSVRSAGWRRRVACWSSCTPRSRTWLPTATPRSRCRALSSALTAGATCSQISLTLAKHEGGLLS